MGGWVDWGVRMELGRRKANGAVCAVASEQRRKVRVATVIHQFEAGATHPQHALEAVTRFPDAMIVRKMADRLHVKHVIIIPRHPTRLSNAPGLHLLFGLSGSSRG